MNKRRKEDAVVLFKNIAQQIAILQEALTKAYTARPEHNKEAERKLTEAIAKAKRLEQELLKVYKNQRQKN